jgi:multiple sugar transport system substrate-binding protein
VAATSPGHEPPSDWDEALDLAADLDHRTGIPLAPAHSISSFLTLVAGAGGEPAAASRLAEQEVGEWALDLLARLAAAGPPDVFEWEPPDALDRLTQAGDSLLYVPLAYGYVTYATDAVARPCRFADVPGATGSVLGGAGLAVSSASSSAEEAAAFAAWASGREAQVEIVAATGGQPGCRFAWDDPSLDASAGGFYSSTRASVEQAWVRPRDPWWPAFQLEAGRLLTRALATSRPATETFRALDELFRERSTA